MWKTQNRPAYISFLVCFLGLAASTLAGTEPPPPPFTPGVCCFGPGSAVCLPATDVLTECFDNGLLYVIGGTCSPNPCPGNSAGACCFGFGNCVAHYNAAACANGGGIFKGAGSNCSTNPCDIAACCFAVAPCQMMLEPACQSAGGAFLPNQICNVNFNPCNPGACCASLTACTMQTAYQCIVVNDMSFLPFSNCSSPGTCSFASGACCYFDGCQIDNSFCGKGAGVFYGVGTTCAEVDCESRACCFANGGCTMVHEDACTSAGGTFLSGNTCFELPCGVRPCCLGANCVQLTFVQCESLGGFSSGLPGQPCTPGLCGAPICPCAGDLNGDSQRNGRDIQRFVRCVILAAGGPIPTGCDCADISGDGTLNGTDVFGFVLTLLGGGC